MGMSVGRRWRRWVVAGMLPVAAAVLAACSQAASTPAASSAAPSVSATPDSAAEQALIAQAKQGGKVQLYTSVDPTTAATLANQFQQLYGIPVQVTRLVSGPLVARYTAEAQAGKPVADVVIAANEPFFADGLSKGWLLPMTSAQVPNIAQLPKTFQYDGSVGVGTSRLSGLAVNTQLVTSGAPTTWQQLTDAKWKGKMVTDDPRTIPVVLAQWQALDKKLGDSYLQKIAQQDVEWAPSLVTGVQEVAAGEKTLAFGINQGHVSPLISTAPNAPVTQPITYLKPVDVGFAWNAGVSAHSGNPAGGRLFINWLLTDQGQQLFNGATLSPSVLPAVTIPGAPPITKDFVDLTTNENIPTTEETRILNLLGLNK
ncbi:ABC transporter substrate-binding protein [Gryllotalpicola protaetiae]|nr:extracellular solute-binding protein [Gryllotalpicola protaetiae]